eukprot:scaffold1423_cov314-Prasinococcus_capsulatus_cf.AAC.4
MAFPSKEYSSASKELCVPAAPTAAVRQSKAKTPSVMRATLPSRINSPTLTTRCSTSGRSRTKPQSQPQHSSFSAHQPPPHLLPGSFIWASVTPRGLRIQAWVGRRTWKEAHEDLQQEGRKRPEEGEHSDHQQVRKAGEGRVPNLVVRHLGAPHTSPHTTRRRPSGREGAALSASTSSARGGRSSCCDCRMGLCLYLIVQRPVALAACCGHDGEGQHREEHLHPVSDCRTAEGNGAAAAASAPMDSLYQRRVPGVAHEAADASHEAAPAAAVVVASRVGVERLLFVICGRQTRQGASWTGRVAVSGPGWLLAALTSAERHVRWHVESGGVVAVLRLRCRGGRRLLLVRVGKQVCVRVLLRQRGLGAHHLVRLGLLVSRTRPLVVARRCAASL